jgi:hypothetical protein
MDIFHAGKREQGIISNGKVQSSNFETKVKAEVEAEVKVFSLRAG